jgi:hypothetical protein
LRAGDQDLNHIAEGVYRLCENSRMTLEHNVRENLHTAQQILQEAGGIQLGGEQVRWEARNQFTNATSEVALPKVLVGSTWLGQIRDLGTSVAVVDKVTTLIYVTNTVFQRMNAAQ